MNRAGKVGPLPPQFGMPGLAEWMVFGAGFLAAVMNSVAGGGTMITFPALLGAGLSPLLANTTSTVALFAGMPGGIWAYRKRLTEVKGWIIPLAIVTTLGGALGGLLLVWLPESVFEVIVPWLILFATGLFLVNAPIQRWLKAGRLAAAAAGESKAEVEPDRPKTWGVVFQSMVGVYGGYFGAGAGIMMLAALGVLGLRDVKKMNALKMLLGALGKVASVICFIAWGKVDWHLALWLLAGSIPGYFAGSYFAQWIPPIVVRILVAVIGLAIAASLLFK